MSLSFTGNLLTGPFLRPDITFHNDLQHMETKKGLKGKKIAVNMAPDGQSIIVSNKPREVTEIKYSFKGPQVHWSNFWGIIPVVGTFVGLGRLSIGVVHTIVHLSKSIFDEKNRQAHLKEAALGAYSIVRGAIEVVPLLPIFTFGLIDIYRLNKYQKIQDEQIIASLKNSFQGN